MALMYISHLSSPSLECSSADVFSDIITI
jgi:hypothetical protein